MITCAWTVCTKPIPNGGREKKYCSHNCKNKAAVARRRRLIKQMALDYMGRKCSLCGYDRCVASLDFHHTSDNKEFAIGASGHTRSWERVKAELDKCILVCRNCHGEIHHMTEAEKMAHPRSVDLRLSR